MTTKTLDYFLAGLMRRYQQRVPNVSRIIQLMVDADLISDPAHIENDHIAFRTLRVPHLGIASLEQIFLHHGYTRRDAYQFPAKKLNAFWCAPPATNYPRVFISELRVDDLSHSSQSVIRSYTDTVSGDPVSEINLDDGPAIDQFLHRSLWPTPTWEHYHQLGQESEYAAWVIYNRYYLNHFTIIVHNLPAPYNTIERFNEFLESHAIVLNDSGGKAKHSRDGLLIQSSTVAKLVEAEFLTSDGKVITKKIPGSYVEFAQRCVLPEFAHLPSDQQTRQHRREGFEASNADKIFESTYTRQTEKTGESDKNASG